MSNELKMRNAVSKQIKKMIVELIKKIILLIYVLSNFFRSCVSVSHIFIAKKQMEETGQLTNVLSFRKTNVAELIVWQRKKSTVLSVH